MPTSSTRSIPSPLVLPSPPFFSSLPLHTACSLCFLSIPASLFTLLTFFCLLTPLSSLSHPSALLTDLLPRPRGFTQLWDTSCSFNDFTPRPRSAREIQLPFVKRESTLAPATPLRIYQKHVYVHLHVRACTKHLLLIFVGGFLPFGSFPVHLLSCKIHCTGVF